MSLLNSTSDRLRRATQLWHAYLTITGQRFELVLFLQDPALEKQTLDAALASGDAKLVTLARDWLRDTGQPVPAVVASRAGPPAGAAANAAAANTPAEPAKPSRYLRGVR
jgi:hypothetical protein